MLAAAWSRWLVVDSRDAQYVVSIMDVIQCIFFLSAGMAALLETGSTSDDWALRTGRRVVAQSSRER